MSSSDNSINIISSNIDIAQNEYVTKYSFNRNFEKLISNDMILDQQSYDDLNIETYNKYKTYDISDLVFYKIKKTDSQLYVLCSLTTLNQHKPKVRKDINTNKLYVINSDYWGIVGGIDYNDTKMAAKDIANQYVSNSKKSFIENHQDNLTLDCHPSGKLGMADSNILFRTFTNISENKSHFYYPYELRSFVANDSIYSGYMRKWDNGLLEYDIIFKLSYAGKTEDGIDLISANNYQALHQNNNFMYFQDDEDYNIFAQGGEYYVNINGTKQVNLNKVINAYSSKIDFIEPFKDLNYMIFTSNVKNVETESYNSKIDIIEQFDNRLLINNKTIIGLKDNSQFNYPLIIPNQIVNIKRGSMCFMEKTRGYDIKIEIDKNNSQLINIDNRAFVQSDLNTISLPYSLRYIGQDAFNNCGILTSLVLYVERDPKKQPHIDYSAFYGTNIKEISVIYRPESTRLFSTTNDINESYQQLYLSKEHISEKLKNPNYRSNIGIIGDPNIYIENEPSPIPIMQTFNALRINDNLENENQEIDNSNISNETNNIITIDVNEFLAELSSMNALKSCKTMLFGANIPIEPTINNIFNFIDLDNGKRAITSFNNIILDDEIKINLQTDSTITQINSNALNGFDKLTSLSVGTNITSIASDAFGYEFNELVLNTDKSFTFNTSFNTICVLNSNCKLSVNSVNNYCYTQNNTIIPTQSISASYIDNLYVNNVKEIQSSAFIDIESINNVYLFSNNINDAIIYSEAFNNDYITDDGEPYYDTNFKNLQLNGYNWTLQPSAFIGIKVDYLSINMLNSHINQKAFYSGFIGTLTLNNIKDADNNEGHRGLYAQSLNEIQINNLTFPDIDSNVSALSGFIRTDTVTTINALTSIGIAQPIIITTSIDSKIFVNNKLSAEISYLNISGTKLNSLTNTGITDMVLIPNYVTEIGSNIAKGNSTIINSVNEIYIPKSVKIISDNAFEGLSNLEYIRFEPGIQLEYIGTNIFKGCSSLEYVVIP